jgi:hypothetical protein
MYNFLNHIWITCFTSTILGFLCSLQNKALLFSKPKLGCLLQEENRYIKLDIS